MSKSKLAKCIACSGVARVFVSAMDVMPVVKQSRHYVQCTQCGSTRNAMGEQNAIAIWNKSNKP